MNFKAFKIVLALILFVPQLVSAQETNQQEQRDQLWSLAQDAEQKLDFAEAANLGEQMYVLEQVLFGEEDAELIGSLYWLADIYQYQENLQKATARLQLALSISSKTYGKDHWRTVDARSKVKNLKRLTNLTGAERDELRRASQLAQKSRTEGYAGNTASAIEAATSNSKILKEVLGEEHPDYLSALQQLARFY